MDAGTIKKYMRWLRALLIVVVAALLLAWGILFGTNLHARSQAQSLVGTATLSMRRDNVVKYGLKPLLKKLEIAEKYAGLHAFRHGLATALADSGNTPIPVLQKQMRHADVRTTLQVYAHVIPQSQREAVEAVSIGTEVPIGTQTSGK